MTDRRLDNWIDSYVAYNKNSEPPIMYHKWVAVSTIAACMQRKCVLHWGDELTFYPNMYIILVAPSGKARKGTAMSPAMKMLSELGIHMAAESITREALIREVKAAVESEINQGTGSMTMHSSLTIFSKELTVFLGYNNPQLIMDLTDWFDCHDRWTYRTKTQGSDEIRGLWVNLIGATTPALIQSALPHDAIGGGLTSRMIFVFEEEKGKRIAIPRSSPEGKQLREDLMYDLGQIRDTSGEYTVDADFENIWTGWYEMADLKPPFKNNPRLAGYTERRPTHLLKLCMIMNAARNGNKIITAEDFEAARSLMTATEVKMSRVFDGVGANPNAVVLARIMTTLKQERDILLSDLMIMYKDDCDAWMLDRMLSTLIQMGTIKRVDERKPTGVEVHIIWVGRSPDSAQTTHQSDPVQPDSLVH